MQRVAHVGKLAFFLLFLMESVVSAESVIAIQKRGDRETLSAHPDDRDAQKMVSSLKPPTLYKVPTVLGPKGNYFITADQAFYIAIDAANNPPKVGFFVRNWIATTTSINQMPIQVDSR